MRVIPRRGFLVLVRVPADQPVGPGDPNPDFRAASPFGKMPALADGDYHLADSSAIIHYLEAKHPEPALIPADPKERGRTVWFDEFADTMRSRIVSVFSDALASAKIPVLDVATRYGELGEALLPIYAKISEAVGTVADVFGELPEEVQTGPAPTPEPVKTTLPLMIRATRAP